MQELIRAYVPEAEQLSYTEAAALAEERDEAAAAALRASCEANGTECQSEQS